MKAKFGKCLTALLFLNKPFLVIITSILVIIILFIPSACRNGGASNPSVPPQITTDGTGGAIFAWLDNVNTGNLYIQHIDAQGNRLWGEEGKLIQDKATNPRFPLVTSDSSGGAFIAWDNVKDRACILTHLDGQGKILWKKDIPNSDLSQMVSDGSGGIIILVRQAVDGPLYVQRISDDGTFLWGVDGVMFLTGTRSWSDFSLAGNGLGGAMVAWADKRGDNTLIYGQMISSEGRLLWANNGIPLADGDSAQLEPKVISDGQGNFIIVWLRSSLQHESNIATDIYAQKINNEGERLWGTQGIPICITSGHQWRHHRIVSDGSGGCIVVWDDTRNSPKGEVYAQRVASDGTILWNTNGTMVWRGQYSPSVTWSTTPRDEQVVVDNAGGAILAWNDIYTEKNICAQRLDSKGETIWPTAGVKVFDSLNNFSGFFLVISDGKGGAIFGATVGKTQQRVQRINASGEPMWGQAGITISR